MTTSLAGFTPFLLGFGEVISVKLSARIGTNNSDGFCGGLKQTAAGLRLYYDASAQPTNVNSTIGAASNKLYFHSDGTACAASPSSGVTTRFLDTNSPGGTVKCADSAPLDFAGGNPYQVIGTWSMTQP